MHIRINPLKYQVKDDQFKPSFFQKIYTLAKKNDEDGLRKLLFGGSADVREADVREGYYTPAMKLASEGEYQAVGLLAEKFKARKDLICEGYASVKSEKVKNYLKVEPKYFARGYAIGGHVKEVAECIKAAANDEERTTIRYHAEMGYIIGDHFYLADSDWHNHYLAITAYGYRHRSNMVAAKGCISQNELWGFAAGGHHTSVMFSMHHYHNMSMNSHLLWQPDEAHRTSSTVIDAYASVGGHFSSPQVALYTMTRSLTYSACFNPFLHPDYSHFRSELSKKVGFNIRPLIPIAQEIILHMADKKFSYDESHAWVQPSIIREGEELSVAKGFGIQGILLYLFPQYLPPELFPCIASYLININLETSLGLQRGFNFAVQRNRMLDAIAAKQESLTGCWTFFQNRRLKKLAKKYLKAESKAELEMLSNRTALIIQIGV